MVRSAWLVMVVLAVPVLLAELDSAVVVVAVAEFVSTVPLATVASLVVTVIVMVVVAPAARVGCVGVTVPVPPTAGVDVDQPGGAVNDTNVVPVGNGSVSTTFCAGFGPALCTVIV